MRMRKTVLFFLAVIMVIGFMPQAFAAKGFKDVPRNHWAYEAIMDMANKGIIDGYRDGTFRPNNKITRAEFAKIMIAAAGIDIYADKQLKPTFADVDRNHWAFYYVEYAKPYLTGYRSGSVYTYKPNENAVREDIAVALVRLMGYDTKKADLSLLNKFRDENRISPALRPFIAIALETKLIQGFEDRTFRPQDPLTRAEAAMLLYRAKLHEDKIVFPTDPAKPQPPEIPTSISDNFSDNKLTKWDVKNANADWQVVDKMVTAEANNQRTKHFFLPLKWEAKETPRKYELAVDVIADGTDGYAGLYIAGKDDIRYVIYVDENSLKLSTVNSETKSDSVIASMAYKLKKTNKLKLVVDGDNLSIYLDGKFMFGQQKLSISHNTFGLYMQDEAVEDAPRYATYLDNFSFVRK